MCLPRDISNNQHDLKASRDVEDGSKISISRSSSSLIRNPDQVLKIAARATVLADAVEEVVADDPQLSVNRPVYCRSRR